MEGKCDKCGIEFDYPISQYYIPHYSLDTNQRYSVCYECWREWVDNGHYKMWCDIAYSERYRLADKFALDFLGKLGE